MCIFSKLANLTNLDSLSLCLDHKHFLSEEASRVKLVLNHWPASLFQEPINVTFISLYPK